MDDHPTSPDQFRTFGVVLYQATPLWMHPPWKVVNKYRLAFKIFPCGGRSIRHWKCPRMVAGAIKFNFGGGPGAAIETGPNVSPHSLQAQRWFGLGRAIFCNIWHLPGWHSQAFFVIDRISLEFPFWWVSGEQF